MALDFIRGNDLISAVAVQLRAAFTQKELPAIYKDKPRQNFIYPSVHIDLISQEQQKEMRHRGHRAVFLDLRIHPQRNQDTAQSWCRDVAEKMMDVLAGLWFKGTLMHSSLMDTYYVEKDQVQHLLIAYNFKTLRVKEPVEDPVYLETLKHSETIKYGKE